MWDTGIAEVDTEDNTSAFLTLPECPPFEPDAVRARQDQDPRLQRSFVSAPDNRGNV